MESRDAALPPTQELLAARVAARICHDLVSPVGAIENGLDLMREIGAGNGEIAIVADSARRASALLQFHRLAFGDASGGGLMTQAEIGRRIQALATNRVGVEMARFPEPEAEPVPRAEAQIACLMMLAGKAMLGMEGRLVLSPPCCAGAPVNVTVEGRTAAASPEQEDRLTAARALPLPDPRQIEFALLPMLAAGAGRRLVVVQVPGMVRLSLPH